jgi:hypothetical protein
MCICIALVLAVVWVASRHGYGVFYVCSLLVGEITVTIKDWTKKSEALIVERLCRLVCELTVS